MTRMRVQMPEGESGDFEIAHFTDTTTRNMWQIYLEMKKESHESYTVLLKEGCPMPIMQDSEAEYNEHVPLFENATGDVLIGGLGIGFCHQKLIDNPDVTSVTIVEKYQEVVDLVWEHCPKDDRFSLVVADIEEWEPSEGTSWDYAWFDAWVFNNPMSYEDHMTLMQERYADYIGDSGQWQSQPPPV